MKKLIVMWADPSRRPSGPWEHDLDELHWMIHMPKHKWAELRLRIEVAREQGWHDLILYGNHQDNLVGTDPEGKIRRIPGLVKLLGRRRVAAERLAWQAYQANNDIAEAYRALTQWQLHEDELRAALKEVQTELDEIQVGGVDKFSPLASWHEELLRRRDKILNQLWDSWHSGAWSDWHMAQVRHYQADVAARRYAH